MGETRIAVIGSRGFTCYPAAEKILLRLLNHFERPVLVSGGARGADKMAEIYAEKHNIPIHIFPAEWGKYGKSAGYKRNHTIWENADMGIAFWDGMSKGTAHSFDLAKRMGKTLWVYNYGSKEWFVINPKHPKSIKP